MKNSIPALFVQRFCFALTLFGKDFSTKFLELSTSLLLCMFSLSFPRILLNSIAFEFAETQQEAKILIGKVEKRRQSRLSQSVSAVSCAFNQSIIQSISLCVAALMPSLFDLRLAHVARFLFMR